MLTINYRVCAGSAAADLAGPYIAGVRPNGQNGAGAIGSAMVNGTLLSPNTCAIFSDTWVTDQTTGRVSVRVNPRGEPESQWADYYAANFG